MRDALARLSVELTPSSVVAVIPARYASSRFPGKPLADLHGRPMIEHVWRRATAARRLDAVLVATDDRRIADAVEGFGGQAVMTRADHRTGTDRLAEVATALPCAVIVNVQGDEPLLASAAIDTLVDALQTDGTADMSTLSRPVLADDDVASPHLVKVVTRLDGSALYFSRSAIPMSRETSADSGGLRRVHLGLYAYRRDVLLRLAALAPTPLECAESLEQLRALEHGYRIRVAVTDHLSFGVDTPEDLERARRHLAAGAPAA